MNPDSIEHPQLTIRANAWYGYHYKYWIAPIGITLLGSIIVTVLFIPQFAWIIIPLLVLGTILNIALTAFNVKNRYVELYSDRVVLHAVSTTHSIPFDKLEPVHYGAVYGGGRNFKGLFFVSKELDINDAIHAQHYTLKDMDTLFKLLPEASKTK